MMKFVMFGFVMFGVMLTAEGQTLSFFKALPGSNNSYAMLVDASGVYSFDDRFRKYDRDGVALWSREYPGGQTVAWLASSGAGLYAAGHLPANSPVGFTDAFVRLYDLQGNVVWNRQFGFANSSTINRAIAADASGVYVAGTVHANGPLSHYLRMYDDRGTELWTKRFEDPDFGFAALASDSTGVYVRGGRSFRKYNASGTEVWSRKLDAGSAVYDMKANATGVYLTGYNSSNRYFLSRYDSSGSEVWTRYGQSGWVALDANSVYVTAATTREPGQCASGSEDVFVIRYDLDGKILWTRQFGTYRTDYPRAIASDLNGVFVAGSVFGALGGGSFPFLAKLEPASVTASTSEPRIRNECVVNAASYVGGAVSPGEILTIFGTALGPSRLLAARGERAFGTELGETRVLFDSIPAPLLYTSSGQVGVVVPNSVANQSLVGIQVEYRGVLSNTVTLPVLEAHPGIFSLDASGSGQAAVLNEDKTLNSAANPAKRGSIISIFATGGGETNPVTADGQIIGNATPLKAAASVFFGYDPIADDSIIASASYAGAVPGSVAGLLQVNVRLPETLPVGTSWLGLSIHSAAESGLSPFLSVQITVK